MFEADHLYLNYTGWDTCHCFPISDRGQLFQDEDFAAFYALTTGEQALHTTAEL